MLDVIVGFGANLGDPPAVFAAALDRLSRETRVIGVSRLWRTRPIGPDQPEFRNAAALLRWPRDPLRLLRRCRDIEADAGRRREAEDRWGPRVLDLDLLAGFRTGRVVRSGATLVLAGRPNAGKSSIFNMLTGAKQHVGNWPGKTVVRAEGAFSYENKKYKLVDLPGTYSLTAYSMEELVARNFLVNEKPAVVVDIVDAANLERNLYLAIQFMEMGVPVVIALNARSFMSTARFQLILRVSTPIELPRCRLLSKMADRSE